MRRILVDAARLRAAADMRCNHADRAVPPSVDIDRLRVAYGFSMALCALDDALEKSTQIDPRRAKVIELRFFGGLSVDETAEALDVSPQTVMRDWRLARAWLSRELR